MRISAYELANRLSQRIDEDDTLTGTVDVSVRSGVSVHGLDELLIHSTISSGNLAKLTKFLGLTEPAYYEYVAFDSEIRAMVDKLRVIGFKPLSLRFGPGAMRVDKHVSKGLIRWVSVECEGLMDGTDPKVTSSLTYEVSVGSLHGGRPNEECVVASGKTYHEACNIAYLQTAVLGWEGK